MSEILYVFDDTARAPDDWPPGARVVLAPMTADHSFIEAMTDKIKSRVAVCETVNYAQIFNATAFALRDTFIEFMATFPEKPLFRGEGSKFSLWWLSPVAEKSPFAGSSFSRLAALFAVVDIARRHQCDEVWVDFDDIDLIAALTANKGELATGLRICRPFRAQGEAKQIASALARSLIHITKLAAKTVTARWAMRGTNPAGGVKNAAFLPVTYFPLLDKASWAAGRWQDKYFGPLQLEMEKKYPGRLAWLAIYSRFDDISWSQSLAFGREVVRRGHAFSFIEQWLGLFDLAWVWAKSASAGLKFISARRTFADHFIFKYQDSELNIWPVFKGDWYRSFCGPGLMQGLAYYRVFHKVFSLTTPGTTGLYMAEMLAWEKALNIAAKEHQELKVIGIQHTIVPLLLLNYFNYKTELLNDDGVSSVPQPDYLACVGRIPLKLFLDCGWPERKVFVLGAIRFQHFKRYMEDVAPWGERENTVIVALSISPTESKEVLRFVARAFSNAHGYRVLIKGHRACPVGPLLARLNIDLDPEVFTVTEKTLPELLPRAKAMVVTESSSTLDAIANECPVIVPRLAKFIDMNPLSGLSDLPFYADSPMEMSAEVEVIMRGSRSPVASERGRRFISDYCDFPVSQKEFLTRIETAGKAGNVFSNSSQL